MTKDITPKSGTTNDAGSVKVRTLSEHEVRRIKEEAGRRIAPRIRFLDDWRRRSMHTSTIWD